MEEQKRNPGVDYDIDQYANVEAIFCVCVRMRHNIL